MKIINMVRLIDKESIPAGVCLLSLHDRHLPNDTRPSSNRDGAVILISMSRRLSFHQSFRVSEIYWQTSSDWALVSSPFSFLKRGTHTSTLVWNSWRVLFVEAAHSTLHLSHSIVIQNGTAFKQRTKFIVFAPVHHHNMPATTNILNHATIWGVGDLIESGYSVQPVFVLCLSVHRRRLR